MGCGDEELGSNILLLACRALLSPQRQGLDIGDVDLIICYDSQPSSTRMVQRMGRTGRKRNGRVVQFTSEGTESNRYKRNHTTKARIYKVGGEGWDGKWKDGCESSHR